MFYKIYHWIAQQLPKVQFRNRRPLTEDEKKKISELLAKDYYIILTANNYHLSSILVRILTLFATGRWPRFSHVLMNVDFIQENDRDKFKFMEATVTGVHHSTFDEIFDCTNYCLLKPRNIHRADLTKSIDELIENDGKPYDDLFDLVDDKRMSCVELVRDALMEISDYDKQFPNLEKLVTQKRITPEDFFLCKDFITVLIRK